MFVKKYLSKVDINYNQHNYTIYLYKKSSKVFMSN